MKGSLSLSTKIRGSDMLQALVLLLDKDVVQET
jgi:hypothetical protein